MRDRGKRFMLWVMKFCSLLPYLLALTSVAAQEPDGDAWYYDRIASQERPGRAIESVPRTWQDGWNPFVRRARREMEQRLARERELPRLRFELQGDSSNRYALFRCVESEIPYSITWEVDDPVPLDDIFLLPTRIPQADGTIRQFGFPERSYLEISATGRFDETSRRIDLPTDEETSATGFPTRIALDGSPVMAWRWVIDEPYAPFRIGYLAVSEIFVLAGESNLAASGRLRWSESFLPDRTMLPRFLRDGMTPLGLPLLREDTQVLGYHSEIKEEAESTEEWIELVWDVPQEIAEIRLVPTQQRVLPHTETFGFPLAHRTEFFLGEKKLGSRSERYAIDPGQNVVTVAAFDGRAIDRVRWSATELWQRRSSRFLSLAEIEAINGAGENVAADAELRVSSAGIENTIWNLEALTDGLGSEGRLLPVGEWLRRLDEARIRQRERHHYTAVLRRAGQLTNRSLLGGLIVILLGAIILSLRSRARERERYRAETVALRRRLAADLHDDLGGNLGSIALLADEARSDQGGNEDLSRVVELARESRLHLKRILSVGEGESGIALESEPFLVQLRLAVHDFFGEAGKISLDRDAEAALENMSPEARGQILFLAKEAFHNIHQHGDAETVTLAISAREEAIAVRITDDSSEPVFKNGKLRSSSLRRRIRHLGAAAASEPPEVGRGNVLLITIPHSTP